MKIKDRISTYFTLITAFILIVVLSAVYFTFYQFLQADFFNRLKDRTMVTANLYLEADEISRDSLSKIRDKYLEKLNGEVIRIYNSNNSAVFIGDTQQYWSSRIINKVRKSSKIQFRDDKRQVVGIFYKDNQGDFVILASAEDRGSQQRLDKLLKIMTIVFVVICIALWLTGRWFAKKTLSPIDGLIKQVKQIKSSNLHYRLDEGKGKDEISLLAYNFNTLLIHLENDFELQKTFVANASHELRTPITSIIMGTEITLSQERERADYKEALISVKEDAEKLSNIIKVLMDLANTDIEFASANTSTVYIKEFISSIKNEWNQKIKQDFLIVSEEYSEELKVAVNPSLLQIAVNNIIVNAFKFSDHKPVQITIKNSQENISIVISDTGIGIEKSEIKSIFKPFYRSANASEHEGNGLGLYMANKIINLYRGDIKVHSTVGKTSFTIRLPLI